MIDLRQVCINLALRYAPGTLTTPSGASAVRSAASTRPKGIVAVPAAFVEVTDGTVVANPSQWKHEIALDVVFLLSKRPGDPARVEVQRQLWLPTLLAATEAKLTVGLAGQSGYSVDKVIPSGWEFAEYLVGAEEYDAVVIHFTAYVTETVSLVA